MTGKISVRFASVEPPPPFPAALEPPLPELLLTLVVVLGGGTEGCSPGGFSGGIGWPSSQQNTSTPPEFMGPVAISIFDITSPVLIMTLFKLPSTLLLPLISSE